MKLTSQTVWKVGMIALTVNVGFLSSSEALGGEIFSGKIVELKSDRVVVSNGKVRKEFLRARGQSEDQSSLRIGEHVKVHYDLKAQSITPVAEDNQRAGRTAPEASGNLDDRAFYGS